MKTFLKLGALVLFCLAQTGCGEETYEIEEIDEEEAAQHEADIEKQMQEEMEKQMGGG